MDHNNEPSSDFRLGKIEANTENINTNIQAMREEFGTFGKRLSETESRIARIEAESAIRSKDYDAEKFRNHNHQVKVEAYMSTDTGRNEGTSATGKLLMAVIGMLIMMASLVVGYVSHSQVHLPEFPVKLG